jgi:hypothetical protein
VKKVPRNYKSKDVQTKKELAGEQNMTDKIIKNAKQDGSGEVMEKLIPIFDKGVHEKATRGTNWSAEDLADEIRKYFQFCADNDLKPNKAGARTWLGCSRSQYHAWQSEPSKYGEISDIIEMANSIMENQYINRGEKYPTMNVFLLKAGHDYAETQNINISGGTSQEEVDETIKKLGLDKE